jgi:signal transduction histidine kinase
MRRWETGDDGEVELGAVGAEADDAAAVPSVAAPDSDRTPASDPFHSLRPEVRHRQELSAIHSIGRLIAEQLEVDGVLSVATRHLSEAVGGANAFVMLLDGDTLRTAATTSSDPFAKSLALRLDAPSIAAMATRTNQPVLIADASNDPRVDRGLVSRFGHTSILAVPLRARGRTVGCVVLGHASSEGRFDDEDVEHTIAIGNQLAIAIANARLIEDLKSSYAELERTQKALVEKERLAALGELSAVIAHEVRNPLAILWNSIGALRRRLRPEGEVDELLAIMTEESQRLNRMVSDLLDYARPHLAELRPEALEPIVRESIAAARAANASRELRIELDAPSSLPRVEADARLLRQALLNLVANALQATPDGGVVRVRVALDSPRDLRIEVIDEGPGLSSSASRRLFEPFFTTKPTGTGLGLALVKRIVDAHHGEVLARSNPKGGATFSLRLPTADRSSSV